MKAPPVIAALIVCAFRRPPFQTTDCPVDEGLVTGEPVMELWPEVSFVGSAIVSGFPAAST